MRTMTATEASRNFSDLLDLVQKGEVVRVTRGGQAVAEIGPTRRRTGADLEAALTAAGLEPVDEDVERDIADAVAMLSQEAGDPWGDA